MTWIQTYMDDRNYSVHHVVGNGDCFFQCIVNAMRDNHDTHDGSHSRFTVQRLRRFVAARVTEQMLATYKALWQDANTQRNGDLILRFRFMQNIQTLTDLKQVVMTRRFFADEMVISILERDLLLRCVIFSEQRFSHKQFPCLQTAETIESSVEPQWYIMLTFNGGHYDLVSYNTQLRFRKNELPPDLQLELYTALPVYRQKTRGWEQPC